MKHWVFALLSLVFINWKPAFGIPPLSTESRLVRAAYKALKANPAAAGAQLAYLSAFPKSRDKFLRIFMDAPRYGQLYDGHAYIEALRSLGTRHPSKVLAICFGVERTMSRTSDAVAYLADVTVSVGITHPRIFAEEARRLARTEQVALCRFLADEEGIEHDPEYEQLRELLGKAGATGLSKELQRAKKRRIMQLNH